jgi:hypothetical protein
METLTPKNEKQSQQPKVADNGERGIPVYELRFCTPNGRDIGLESTSAGGVGVVRRNDRVDITYFPQRRFHRIVETTDPKKKPKTIYIPESWATWEPAE